MMLLKIYRFHCFISISHRKSFAIKFTHATNKQLTVKRNSMANEGFWLSYT